MKYNDSPHEIITDVRLRHNGVLHRFNNPAGAPYSAIYVGNHEEASCERYLESCMIRLWNRPQTGAYGLAGQTAENTSWGCTNTASPQQRPVVKPICQYYEIVNTHSEYSSTISARWQTLAQAKQDMQNYSDWYASNGTGGIQEVTVSVDANGHIYVDKKEVYRK